MGVASALAFMVLLAESPLQAKDEPMGTRVAGTVVLRGDPDGVSPVQVVTAYPRLRFNRPLWIGALPDGSGRMVVVEQDGVIRAFANQPEASSSSVLLDWRSRTYRRHNEEGLLGLAFHPEFQKNRTLFIHYSADNPRRGVVSRFKMDARFTRIDPGSEQVILEQPQPWGNHNGGDLQFGPDGYLYITFGDGGAGDDPLNSGQDLSTWLGSILRIEVGARGRYRVPKDNPFVGQREVRPEIWAYGLRNVWRMSFDRETGQLYAGDVGQNAWEEIDIIVRGGNYGWKVKEGTRPFARAMRGGRGRRGRRVPTPEQIARPVIDPIIEFPVSEARSITGGHVYRGAKHPQLRGVYLYADYATGNIWGLRYDGAKVTQNRLLARGRGIASFGEDADGEVYFASFDGRIYTFRPSQGGAQGTFPTRLSETGLFTDTAKAVPHASLLPYDVNVPLWSDGAAKQRHIMLPGLSKVQVNDDGTFRYPVGTIFVKTFHAGTSLDAPRLETRLMVHRERGWAGYTYIWDADQRDARLADNRVELPLPRGSGLGATWTVPSRSDCMACHTAAGGFVLGFRAEQLAREGGGASSLTRLESLGCFEGKVPAVQAFPRWDDSDADAGRRARAYLDANCAMCHQPGGPGNATLDLRHHIPLEAMRLDEAPGQGDLGIRGARQVVPGAPRRSILRERMNRTDAFGMPNLSYGKVDAHAVSVIDAWIRAMRR